MVSRMTFSTTHGRGPHPICLTELDTIINHGWEYVEPLINLPRIIQLTGPRRSFESEQSYLNRFLVTRRQLMCCYPDKVWPPAADRVSDLQTLVSNWSTNVNLTNPA